MKYYFSIFIVLFGIIQSSCYSDKREALLPEKVTFTKEQLYDKIKGGWAGQAIGVSFGSHTEFRYNGTFIQDFQPIPYHEGYVKELMNSWPDLFDDIYMDLTFVEVLDRVGMDAPVDSFAYSFAYADYNLWHANQAARYNIMQSIKNPGHWLNNPHADDIDYLIEADFAGLMNPGMPNSASEISDRVGHIMNYGDGWYGGVYIGAMYTLAFISDDIKFIVNEALKTIPTESKFYKCIANVIKWHKEYPDDWHQTWLLLQKSHSDDIGCPDGIFSAFNIDARINTAYVVLGLLYGQGNYTRTLEISTRAGQDSDCNPASAGGILGVMYGYDSIPEYWKKGLAGAEDINFKYTNMSLNKVYNISFEHTLKMIERNNGRVDGNNVIIQVQRPQSVKYEQSFEDMFPISRINYHNYDFKTIEFDIDGTGFVLRGDAGIKRNGAPQGELTASLYIDGEKIETAAFPTDFKYRRHDLFWKYQLPKGKHKIKVEVDIHNDYFLRSWDYIVYSDQPNLLVHPE